MQFVWENIGHEPFYILTAVENVLKLNYVVDACAMCMYSFMLAVHVQRTLSVLCACSMPNVFFFNFCIECNIFIGWRSMGGRTDERANRIACVSLQMQFVFLISVHTMWQMINAIRNDIKTTTITCHFKIKWQKLENKFSVMTICYLFFRALNYGDYCRDLYRTISTC